MNLAQLVATQAERYGARQLALVDGEPLSYEQLAERAGRFTSGLQELGIQPGDRVAVMMPTRAEFLYAWFGILGAGAIEVPIHDAARGPGIAYILETTGARALIVDEEHVEHVAGHIDSVEHVIVRGDAGELEALDFASLMANPVAAPGRAQAERSRLDPLHRRHDRPAQGRRAPAQPQPEPGAGRRRARPATRRTTCCSRCSRSSTPTRST